MSFSIAATPESLMLQHRQPLASSRNSSVLSAVGSEGEETLMVFATGEDLVRCKKERSMESRCMPSMS